MAQPDHAPQRRRARAAGLAAALAASGALLLAGPAATPAHGAAPASGPLEPTLTQGRTLTLGPADDGRSVNLRRGEQLRLVLPGNAGTGYRWVIEAIDRSRLQLLGAELWSDPGPPLSGGGRAPGLVGGPQQTTFLFRAVGSGESELRLIHWPGPARAGADDPRFRLRVRSVAP